MSQYPIYLLAKDTIANVNDAIKIHYDQLDPIAQLLVDRLNGHNKDPTEALLTV